MILQEKNMQEHQHTWNGGNVRSKMLGENCNVMAGSKECGRGHTSVTKNDWE